MSKTEPESFAVVGIGASAGGLQALQQFFAAMPTTSGMAFVIVTHLAAEQESHLTELIQPHTTMPVLQVQEWVKIERNHVYVIPPNRNISTIDSHLRLSPMEEARRNRAPIDHFFRTLAGTHGEQAVGIVLSGTGSDGTIGLQRIKEAGGLALVQEPSEAAYDGMPLSAIATGLVDLILPIQAMPARLLDYASRVLPEMAPSENGADAIDRKTGIADDEPALLRQILAQVRRQTGQDFSRYKRSSILRRIQRRLQVHQLADLSAYARFLRANEQEVTALYHNLLISVTNFFRDPAVFTRLEQEVIPALFTGKGPNDSVRLWVVGCATGEEAYSLAMLLLEQASRLDYPVLIQIFATDLSEPALLRGRTGWYPETISADVSLQRLERFFHREENGYRINQLLRDCILFAPHNLFKDPPFSKLDLITCRNLLIYLEREIHAQVFELFHYALRPNGYLVLSPSESIERVDLFHAINQKQSIFQRTTLPTLEVRLPMLSFSPANRTSSVGLRPLIEKQPTGYGGLHQRLVDRYAPPSVLINADYTIVHLSEQAGRYLHEPGGEPTQHLLKRIHPELRLELTGALYAAVVQQRSMHVPAIRILLAGETRAVGLHILPTQEPDLPGYLLVIFEEREETQETSDAATTTLPGEALATSDKSALNLQLMAELERTKQTLRNTIEEFETNREEMRAGHEELLSINEEMKSTTEELETGKEELQSINEELFTTNAELKFKIEELGRANSDLLNLMAATDVGVIFLDRSLRIKRFTPPAATLFHLIDSDLDRLFAHIAHRLQHRRLPELAARVLETQVGIEEIEQSADGRWYILRLFPYRTVVNVVEGVVITFVDISELKRAEHELQLRIQQSALADLGRQALQGGDLAPLLNAVTVCVVDMLNLEFCQVLAWQATDKRWVQQAGVGWQVGIDAEASHNAHAEYVLQAKEPVVVGNFQTETRFAPEPLLTAHTIVSGISLVIPGRSEPYGLLSAYSRKPHTFTTYEIDFLQAVVNLLAVALTRKVTEEMVMHSEAQLQRLNATLEQRIEERTTALARSNHDLGQFAYIAAHDLKAPLRAIDLLADWITQDDKDNLSPASMEHFAKLRGRIKRMDKLLDDLLAYARIGRYTYTLENVNTRTLINDIITLMAPPPGFVFVLAEEMPILITVRVPLEAVLRNLLSNAIKHHDRDVGEVRVSVRDVGRFVEFTVADDGPGIAEQDQTRIFELFQTLRPRDEVEGSGIGLAIVKKIVETQAGVMTIVSGPGRGASFCFTWPKQISV